MEKIEKYRQVVLEVLEEIADMDGDNTKDSIPTQVIRDHEGGHYLLFSDGWREIKRVYGCFLHIDIARDGKIWLQHDGTDLIVGQMLLDRGIPHKDLVIGFHHPTQRADTDFAVA